MHKKYIVRLTDLERDVLRGVIKKFSGSRQKVRRAQIFLKCDADGPNWTDQQVPKTGAPRRLADGPEEGRPSPPMAMLEIAGAHRV